MLLSFCDKCFSQGLSVFRVVFYPNRLLKIARLAGRNLDKLDFRGIKELVEEIEKRYSSENTKHDYKVALKKFYQWLEGFEWGSKEYPERVKWIRTTVRNDRKLPEEILSKDE